MATFKPTEDTTMGLLYGPGNITRAELNALPEPVSIGPWHHPVPFGDYVQQVSDALAEHGATIMDEEFQLVKNGMRLFGAMTVRPADADTFLPGTGTDLIVGLRGSHDKIVPRGLCIGTRVMVCSNLCFNGNLSSLQTRQTTNVLDRLPIMINEVVGQIHTIAANNVIRIDAYKNKNLKTSDAGDAVIVDLFRREVLNLQQLQTALSEWVEPTYGEHQADGDYSMWNLYNAVTQSFKPTGERAKNVYNHDELNRRSTLLVNALDSRLKLKLAA
jgi:hypothetical protein